MDGMPLRRFARFTLMPVAILALAACGQVNSAKNSVNGANNSGGGTGSSAPIPSGTVVNSAGFFVAITGTQHSDLVKYLHQADAAYGADVGTTNFSSTCKIADGAADGGDILCIAEINELDLYFDDINIQYHVPSNMCNYLVLKPYWFYDFEPGIGPSLASSRVELDGTVTDVLNTVSGVPTCPYDYSSIIGGANCCPGSYTHMVTTLSSTAGPTTVTSTGTWGGKVGNCAAGVGSAASSGFSRDTFSNVPMKTIQYISGTGVNSTFLGTSPINTIYNSIQLASNVWTANFYNPSDHPTGGKPIGLQQPAAVSATNTFYLPSDTYAFNCEDTAGEMKQRIRLMIREWNEEGQNVEGGDPDTTGAEPNFPALPLNDVSDWKDFGDNTYPASSI